MESAALLTGELFRQNGTNEDAYIGLSDPGTLRYVDFYLQRVSALIGVDPLAGKNADYSSHPSGYFTGLVGFNMYGLEGGDHPQKGFVMPDQQQLSPVPGISGPDSQSRYLALLAKGYEPEETFNAAAGGYSRWMASVFIVEFLDLIPGGTYKIKTSWKAARSGPTEVKVFKSLDSYSLNSAYSYEHTNVALLPKDDMSWMTSSGIIEYSLNVPKLLTYRQGKRLNISVEGFTPPNQDDYFCLSIGPIILECTTP
jgi:hypothetical protein